MIRPHSETPLAALHGSLEHSLRLLGKDGYPSFSWDKDPLYAQLAVEPEMNPEPHDLIAEHFSPVTLSAGKVRQNVEPILAKAAAEIKKSKLNGSAVRTCRLQHEHGAMLISLENKTAEKIWN